MSTDTGLFSGPTAEQQNVIRSMLRSGNRDDGATNVSIAFLQIVAYCNIFGGVASSNPDEPISGIPGMG